MSSDPILGCALANPVNVALLDRLARLGLPQCHLAAGCIFQAVWNQKSGRDAGWGVRDYDVFYFDAADLSFEAEDRVIRRVEAATADLGVRVEVRNQARVHLWFERRFGVTYPPLGSARESVDRFLIACTCVAVEVGSRTVYAPDGFGDLEGGILRMNAHFPQPERFRLKADDYRPRWPWLTVAG
ncbi:nucleotidyltransferase family protein [Aurantimonas sp. VKM B-3413]|uniref:nucleotidyltransferase family protein n=1 Tax=Aurantimonas sp. VKM B-3413 TaxID=2779401 RepID=UPI001E56810E|nr:nucleotidyltransferase family protein [Aurantimonas sp. VKM B-3413]MCB8836981.1 nucleotidyltransferase family protein [Aurantimonas sp. VKM B-3413]